MAFRQYARLDTLYRLGSSYTSYRLLLSIGLFGILLLTMDNLIIGARNPLLYIAISSIYLSLCIINFFTFKFYQKKRQEQIFVYLIIDVIHITLILFLSSGPNIAIVLLYMVVVLTATMLVTPRKALTLTLLSVIAVVYQQFFFSIFDGTQISFIGSSALVAMVFISTYALGQIAVKRLRFVETLAVDQRKEIIQLQNINQSIIEQLDTGFMVIDDNADIITLNEAARLLLGLTIQSLQQHKNLNDIQKKLYQELKQQSQQNIRGIFHYFSEPDAAGISVQYRPIATQQQQFTLLIFESLQRINQHVQQLKLASLGQLSASIAHEIRNPLAAISQANELIAEDQIKQQKLLTDMIQKQCLRINRIIEDTLNMSRQNHTLPEDIALSAWLQSFIQEDLSDIQQFLQLDIEEQLCVYFDPHQLRLVLINLIRNAIRHGHERQPESKIQIQAHHAGDDVFINIIDQGSGVPEQQQHNLFEPFHSTATDGTGLGLYLSKTFCEANHARLKYVAQTQGACFRIECLASNNN
ncbi:sensor histidine kinase [Acinetobacter puyangensis]|uniref:sensor histidine kinase n=1 Tax=Acinetobacter puyangensis TaxID=1096779 RepID=UPI003A4D9BFE